MVVNLLAELIQVRGVPKHLRSDNCPAFIAAALCGQGMNCSTSKSLRT